MRVRRDARVDGWRSLGLKPHALRTIGWMHGLPPIRDETADGWGTRRGAFELFLECYIYCAPEGHKYMQKRTERLFNGISGLEDIFGLGGLTKNREQGTGNRDQ